MWPHGFMIDRTLLNLSFCACWMAILLTSLSFPRLEIPTPTKGKTVERALRSKHKSSAVCRFGFFRYFENISKVAFGNGKERSTSTIVNTGMRLLNQQFFSKTK